MLELGSGLGFTGTYIGKYQKPSRLIMTDYADNVIDNLYHNLRINIKDELVLEKILVMNLDWSNFNLEVNQNCDIKQETITNNNKLLLLSSELILGADVVYDFELIDKLVNVLKLFLCDSELPSNEISNNGQYNDGNCKKKRYAFIASKIRTEQTTNYFFNALNQNSISYSLESLSFPLDSKQYSPTFIQFINSHCLDVANLKFVKPLFDYDRNSIILHRLEKKEN